MLTFYLSMIDQEEDKLTFEQIYHDYHKQMLYVAKRFLLTHEDAEDAVQESLIRIARSIKLIPAGNKLKYKAYVMTIVKNVALSMLHREEQKSKYVELSELQFSGYVDPFNEIVKSDDYEALLAIINSLPGLYREVLMLRYVFDISTKDIANILDRNPSTVKQQITRGKKILAELYSKEVL